MDRSRKISRRTFLLFGSTFLLLGLSFSTIGSADLLQDRLKSEAVAIRSIDATDEDFSDLDPLIGFIGGARVVQLGEPSHGAGSSFAAKVRLVKFLHQRMGFDVLVWESGFYDLERTQASLRGTEDPVGAAQRGIFRIWSASEECRPLFEYARASQAGRRPLEMAGYDMQFTATGSFGDFADDLRSFVRALRDPALRRDALQAADETLAAFTPLYAYVDARGAKSSELLKAGVTGAARSEAMAAWEKESGAALRPRKDALERLQPAADRLAGMMSRHAAAFAEVHGVRRHGFMTRAIANLSGYGANLHERFGVDHPAGSEPPELAWENRRDALNADNLRWLLEEGYPGRKIIVWAHNTHVMNAYYASDWHSISLEPRPDSMKTTGVFLAEWLGQEVYTIGMTTYEGEDGLVGAQPVPIPSAGEGSLEERLHRLGLPYAFLDLRGTGRAPGHPLQSPQTMRVPKFEEEAVEVVARPYDAIVYIDRMKPATLIR